MRRITRIDGTRDATILRLEGRLTGTDLADLEATIDECRSDKRRIVVDLAGVGFVDGPVAAALVAALQRDVEIVGASAFVRELLEEIAS
jgi:anti-anti-sigma regulatory factor